MPEGGKVTPIPSGVVARITQAARYVISGVGPNTWFGPMQPLAPMAPPEVKGRQFDYPTGYNLNYSPRSYEPISFNDLRALADSCDILRSVIETRKDQMEALDWNIRIKADADSKRKSATSEQNKRIDAITEFLQSPDQEHSWEQWLRMWLEDMFVIDAASIYKRPNRKGGLYSLEILDGATIRPLIDDSGRRPLAPDPAYQQILKGIPAADYSSDELLYLKHNPRSSKVYGYSHVEQVLMTVNIAIRRSLHQLEYYREGSIPDAILMAPEDWTTDQISGFQKYLDGLMSGNSAQRRKLRLLPASKYQETKQPVLKDEYDEWLARIICFVFSIAPTPFIKQMNRATAQSSHDAALEEGLAPLQKYIRNNLNRIISSDFESPDLEFSWVDDREQDPLVQMQVDTGYVKAGIRSINTVRETIGDDPVGNPAYDIPMPLTATGYVMIKSPEEQQADADAASQARADALQAHVEQSGKGKDDEHGGGDSPPKDDATKLGKGVKKKPVNPYLPTTAHKH